MKHTGKKILSVITACVMTAAMAFASLAAGSAPAAIQNTEIQAVEQYLEDQGTSVEVQLESGIARLRRQAAMEQNGAARQKLEAQAAAYASLLADYRQYEAAENATRGSYHWLYSPAVAAVIGYFESQDYVLAAELLTHARDNEVLDSTYEPVNGGLAAQSDVVAGIMAGTDQAGSGIFPGGDTVLDQDLYYAIHGFNYTKENGILHIYDRYDYAPTDGGSIGGIAINMMYKAQEAGVLVPYQVSIYLQ